MTTALDHDHDTGRSETTPQLRCRIMEIAERLFREIGYRKTTIADIGDALGMSPGNVYRFFPSKKALNEAVAEQLLGDLEAELRRIAVDTSMAPPQRLRKLIASMHEISVKQFISDRRIQEMVEVAMSENWQVVHAHIVRMDAILQQLVADGIASGDFAPQDATVAARCVQSSMIRFCHPALIVQCADEPGPSLDEIADFILAALSVGPKKGA